MNLKCYSVMISSIIVVYLQLVMTQSFDTLNGGLYGTANLSTSWFNNVSATDLVSYGDSFKVRAILVRGNSGPSFACGFFCNGICGNYIFGIFIVQTDNASRIILPKLGFPQVVWSANRNHPVKLDASLQLTPEGDLTLRDVDGGLIWSTNTSGKSVAGMNLTEKGNLVLFDTSNSIVWDSFSYPTDSLLLGQKLVSGQKLIASVSISDWSEGGLYSVSVTDNGLFAYFGSNPPEIYYSHFVTHVKTNSEPSYIKIRNGSLAFFIHSSEPHKPDSYLRLPPASSSSGNYLRLEPDGHLRMYNWESKWNQMSDIFTHTIGGCNYPLACGPNSICSNNKCSCPQPSNTSKSHFKPVDTAHLYLGCSGIIPLDCNAVKYHTFIELQNVSYFTFTTDMSDTDINSCKEACLGNCSCKAAIFRYGETSSGGDCYLLSHLFTINSDKNKTNFNSSIFIKVQTSPSDLPLELKDSSHSSQIFVIVGSAAGAFVGLVFSVGFIVFLSKKKKILAEVEEDYLDFVPGMPTRFSFEDLERATDNFSKKLGEGAYGTVFKGSLEDGTKIAVKSLDGVGKVKKSFLAEVETIANTHHVNLVRLIGFCAENSHRLLVYEYMINGSLDKWIYLRKQEFSLNWEFRKKIVLDIAKGLAYLHEDCRQKVIHLDIKPQNILLDENFNAKISDFGLSKLIDKDQSQVMTTMKGTPGYLAPEWLYAMVTEKVDVYSFGVVVLEILCRRKIMDESETEERKHLLTLFKKKAVEGLFMDMIDNKEDDKDSSFNETEVEKLLRTAGWCLQNDYTNRPSMSIVVKVLEGLVDVDTKVDYNFFTEEVSVVYWPQIESGAGTRLSAVVLSGPR